MADLPQDTAPKTLNKDAKIANFEQVKNSVSQLKYAICNVILGQEKIIDLCLCAVFARSHALLVGMPGLAKTKLVETIANAIKLEFQRVQFTPDLMPSDILGSEILDGASDGTRHFRFIKGPIFTEIFMADEINRASPKTQAALLQAMQERKITIAGQTHSLSDNFSVLATQNPIEHEGAYPLPEAQLDRFLLQINIGYPSKEDEREILIKTTGIDQFITAQSIDKEELLQIQNFIREMPVGAQILDRIIDIVRNLRPQDSKIENVRNYLDWGPSPRAGQALILAAKAHALIRGRLSPTIADVEMVAHSALQHRMALNYTGRGKGIRINVLIDEVIASFGG